MSSSKGYYKHFIVAVIEILCGLGIVEFVDIYLNSTHAPLGIHHEVDILFPFLIAVKVISAVLNSLAGITRKESISKYAYRMTFFVNLGICAVTFLMLAFIMLMYITLIGGVLLKDLLEVISDFTTYLFFNAFLLILPAVISRAVLKLNKISTKEGDINADSI